MSELRRIFQQYLSVRRALGHRLEREGTLLPDFVAFVEAQGSPQITTELALRWARLPAGASPRWWARRLSMVRRFAVHAHALDPRTEIPPANHIAYQRRRLTPYLYTPADVIALMRVSTRLRGPFAAATYRTLVGLLAVTGMRVGEAIALNRSDFDEREQRLIIRHGKFNKSREVPLHRTTVSTLRAYARERDRFHRRPKSPSLLVSQAGTRLFPQNVGDRFARLRRWAGLPTDPRPPRIHDLRHTFAVTTILRWYRAGLDVEPRLPVLSTYLGHVSPSTTYWYLTAVPELIGIAAQRLERSWGKMS